MISIGLFLTLLAVSSAYKKGPPVKEHPDICQHMIPSHGAPPQRVASPITMKFSQDCFKGSQSVKLEVTTSKDTIEGYFVQARVGTFENATKSYGEFRTYTKYSGQYNCFNGEKNAIGHKDDEPDVKKMNLYWTAPSTGLTQDVHIGGTFLIHKTEYWVNDYKTLKFNPNCAQKETGEEEDKKENGATNIKMASGLLFFSVFAILKSL